MSAQLVDSISGLRRTLRRLAVLRGVSLTAACLLALLVLIGGLDWWLHIDESNARAALACAIGLVGLYCVWKWVLQPGFHRLTDLQVAHRIESVHPELSGRLSSSIEFVSGASPGSQELQEEVVSSATSQVAQLPLHELPDRKPLRRSFFAVATMCVLTLSLLLVRPTDAGIAIKRLAFPFRSNPWPRTTDLRIVTDKGEPLKQDGSLRIVRGEFKELLVENTRGQLPDDAAIEYRIGKEGGPRFEPLQPISLDANTTGEVGRAMLAASAKRIYFRAVGGDHRTDWLRLDVVSPPQAKSIKVTITPPKYTGQGPELLPQGDTSINALIGAEVTVRVEADRRIQSASITAGTSEVIATTAENRRVATATFVLREETVSAWWIDLVGEDGIQTQRPPRFELRVSKDQPPTVFIESPQRDLQVTSRAIVPIVVVAEDDLEVTELSLIGQSQQADPNDVEFGLESGVDGTARITEIRVEELKLAPGDRFTLRARARDAFDGQPEHVVFSEPRSLVVVSSDVKRAELAEAHATLLDELRRTLDSQARARDFVSELRIQQAEADLRRADLDLLKRTEADQHRITSGLFDEADGLLQRLRDTADQFAANQITAPEVEGQLNDVLGELEFVRDEVMPKLQSGLTSARKSIEDSLTENAEAGAWLEGVEARQDEIISSLSSVLENSSTWKKTIDLRSSLADITTQQAELNRDTLALGQRELAARADDARQITADRSRVAKRQQRIADQFDDYLEDIDTALKELPADDPTAERVRAARDSIVSDAPSLAMRQAARDVSEGRTGAASTQQVKLLQTLEDLGDILNGPAPTAAETLAERLTELEASLNELATQQRTLIDAIRQSDPTAQAKQSAIRTDAERMERRLNRLLARDAAREIANAIQNMERTESALNEGNETTAIDEAEAADAAIRSAVERTRVERASAEQRQSQTQMLSAANEVRQLVEQQEQLLNRTQTIKKSIEETGRRTRRQSRDLLATAKSQNELAATTRTIAEELEAAEEVSLVLSSAADHMLSAGASLSARTASSQTVSQQQAALDALTEVVRALFPPEPDPSNVAANEESTSETESNQNDSEESQLVTIQARLGLLRALQLSINRRTELIDERTSDDELTAIASQQSRVAELADRLLGEIAEAGQ